MAEIPDAELNEMRRILRASANQFRIYERGERAKLSGPVSIVEAQQAQQAAERNKSFAEACERYAGVVENDATTVDV